MLLFLKLFEPYLQWFYHCFDRIVINGYLSFLTRENNAGQKGQVSIDDDAIEAVIKPLQIRLKKFKKELHGQPFLEFVFCYSNFRKGSHALQEHEPAQQFY